MLKLLVTCSVFALSAPLAAAQTASPAPAGPTPVQGFPAAAGSSDRAPERQNIWAVQSQDPNVRARFQVRVMEGVLEKAVQQAASLLNNHLRTVSPDLVQLTGAARARGYRLDGYGLFFDVQVPAALRHTMGWTFRMLRQNNENVDQALTALRQVAAGLQGRERNNAETAIRLLELQVKGARTDDAPAQRAGAGPVLKDGVTANSATQVDTSAGSAMPQREPREAPPVAMDPMWMQNPDLAYELGVREALIGAMLEWGQNLSLLPDEWLTVAARDSEDVVMPGDPAETVTIILRVKGSDLAELRANRMTTADVRQRVEVREF